MSRSVDISSAAGRTRAGRCLDLRLVGTSAEAHLNDLQADIEAGSRLIEQIRTVIREALPPNHAEQADLLKAFMEQLIELKACVLAQRQLLRELRHDIRAFRESTAS